jgi:predicted metal-dependent hydrolase
MSGLLPQYTHIVKPQLRHTYLSFDGEGNLIIRSPKVSQQYIEQLLLKKAGWITRSREKILKKKGRRPNFNDDSVLSFLGDEIALTLVPYEKKRTRLILDLKGFQMFYSHYDEASFLRQIDAFYKREAERSLPPIVTYFATQMGLSPSEVRFRKTKRQWGSCSAKNIISLNTMLMKLPVTLISYVVVHELAHIVHKHHQKSFWKLVEEYIPDYRACREELHTYTT